MPAAPIPESIKVGHLVYRVHVGRDGLPEDAFTGNDLDRYGGTSNKSQIIYVSNQIADGQARGAVFHEVMHAVVGAIGQTFHPALSMDDESDIEEYAIRVISDPLLGVLRDNPALVAYLVSP